ncbi:MAG: hypothetical protein HYX92_14250 [Chloroflexi bacterium]|nr:hypothetical protein [Chloroflexota bacterium]
MVSVTDVLLNPIGEVDVVKQKLAPRLSDLKGKVGGFVDNNKVNSDVFLARLQELMKEKYGLAGVVAHKKPETALPCPAEFMDDLVKRCDFVVHSHAD